MDNFLDEQYAEAVAQRALLLQDFLKSGRPGVPVPFTLRQIVDMKNFFAHSDAPGDVLVGDLLEHIVREPTAVPQLSMPSKQTQVSPSIETTAQDDHMKEVIESTSGVPSASCGEQRLQSSEKEFITVCDSDSTQNDNNASNAFLSVMSITPMSCFPTSRRKSALSIVDMAFEEDTCLYGMHPANLDEEQSAKLDEMMPTGYRYARELQSDLVFHSSPEPPAGDTW